MSGVGIAEPGRRSTDKYRPDIDGLRAIAVLSVVLFHAGFQRFSGGFVGVDIFFVISGFLITGIVRDQVSRGDFSFATFYVRRMRRLFPALLATVVLSFVAAALFFAPELLKLFGASAAAAVLSFANIYFWLTSGYFDPDTSLKPLVHTWSLSVEEQFYLIWPAILVVASRWRAAAGALVALLAASIVGGTALHSQPSAVFFLMPFRIYELAIGGLLVWVVERVAVPRAAREAFLLLAFALMAFAVLTFSEATPFPINGLVPCIGAALVILCGNADYLGRALRNRLSVGIGLISYSVYLVHWPVVAFYRYAVRGEFEPFDKVLMVALALAGGFAMNRLIENRYRYVRAGSWRPSRFAMACGGLALAVSMVGATAAATGWTWRLGGREAAYNDIREIYGGAGCAPPRCETGSGRPLFVIGDSQALAYFAGMARYLPDRRLIFYESSACPFFSPDMTRDYGPDQADYDVSCRAARQRAFDEIRAANGADVVVAQNWRLVPMISERTSERLTFQNYGRWTAFVGDELADLKRDLAIRNLVVIGPVPSIGNDSISPRDCISRPIRLNDVGCTAAPVDQPPLSGLKVVNDMLRAEVEGIAWFVDPFDYLCDRRECANFRDGAPLYFNQTHLSELGSWLVVEGMLSDSRSSAFAQ